MTEHAAADAASPSLTAQRVTPADVEAAIVDEVYFTAEQGYQSVMREKHPDLAEVGNGFPYAPLALLTFCVLVLSNGTKIVGVNYGAIDPAQHDAQQGKTAAREDAVRQVWPLLGYALRERLHGR